MQRLIPLEHADYVLDDGVHALLRADGSRADVGREYCMGCGSQGVIRRWRFRVEHVEGRPGELIGLQRRQKGVVIDQPAGSRHPRYPEIVYPLDYGYLKGTSGGDGNEIDVWRGSLPAGALDTVVCTVDLHKRDTEVKLLLGCTQDEKDTILAFHSTGGMAAILIRRED